ncbi:MAG: sigma-54-dependent Fis family transcriptional regulator [Deltaproteobacteria bacterium HGW-Deltaproteobacteria-4]|nr:MAG: sigma-54-dependent Fis family transcriptional regulator [Deltaproteobacteria bacterium HGW-Deltaproteobacteria-4]
MSELKLLTLLLVEDEDELRRETVSFLELYCGRVIPARHGREALNLIASERPDLVLSDIRMPVMDGLELAVQMKKLAPDTPLIFCSAFTETDYLLKAIELQAAAFVRKPVDTDELLAVIARVALPVLQRREIQGLSDELVATLKFQLGSTPAQQGVAEQAARVARTSFNVLLEGETGSGKSRLASIIHQLSPRRERPFVAVQLGALPLHLAESELFGHLKGAFTGADRTRAGLVESAQGGTLFLDDIDACPLPLQAKLLRFIEEKKFIPVGSSTEKQVDMRIISASNRNLKEESMAGHFREDLYYRLADVTITLPPLREATETIVPLALKFLRETCDELDRDIPLLDDEACRHLCNMPWPGNVRQLKSVMRRAALNAGKVIGPEEIGGADKAPVAVALPAGNGQSTPPPFPCGINALEKWSLEEALRFCGGKRMKTATMLGMNYYTFRRRLEKHEIATDEV